MNLFSLTGKLQARTSVSLNLLRHLSTRRKIGWIDLINWLKSGQKEALWRNEKQAQLYLEHFQHVESRYASINDYIRIHYLKWNSKFDVESGKEIAVPCSTSFRGPLITKNKFPYDLEENIEHWLIWCEPKPEKVDEFLETMINKHFPTDQYERIAFVNPERLRSISAVFHAHVFTKKLN